MSFKVSVICTVYNEENYVSKMINSLNNKVNEIIVVDDGSDDNTYKIIKT